jgi:minor extracellular protease Epr
MSNDSKKSYLGSSLSRKIIKQLDKPHVYSGESYGLTKSLTGDGVTICVIDTGIPNHPDLPEALGSANMSSESKDALDHQGHATMVAGVIVGQNENTGIRGLAPNASMYYVKVMNSSGDCGFNSLLAAMLWSIVKQCDVVLISLGSSSDYIVLSDAISKAVDSGISVIAAAGNQPGDIDYPAAYERVISVGTADHNIKGKGWHISMAASQDKICTTYLRNSYVMASGTSILAGLVAGLSALVIEDLRGKKDCRVDPKQVYECLSELTLL